MARDIYLYEEKPPGAGRKVLVFLLIILLLAALATGAIIWYKDHVSERTLADFSAALDEAHFARARDIYHKTQERALSPGLLDFNQERDIQTSREMEAIISRRLEEIKNQIERMQLLEDADLDFVEGLGELTAVDMITYLRQLAGRFLRGEASRGQLENAFAQLGELENIRPAVNDLPASFARMEELRPGLARAAGLLRQQEYWPAYELFLGLLAGEDLTSFIYDQIWLLRTEAETLMYEPLLAQAKQLLEGGRYMSAHEELQRLQQVYAEDEVIRSLLGKAAANIPAELAHYTGVLEFVSIRPLIVQPERAFDGDAYAATAADAMLTVNEFAAILSQLHENDYILVDSDIVFTEDGKFAPLFLPPGKKPLVLVIDGLNYYASRRETGNSWDLVLDDDGHVSAVYPDTAGNMVTDRFGEAVGILDQYVRDNPDFSLNGARGTISLTGYECVFGKITDIDQLDDRNWALQNNGMPVIDLSSAEIEANRQEAKAIIDRLKNTGWCFASSTYGYIDARSQPMERIIEDTEKWLDQVGRLTGHVAMLNYPHGSFIPGSDPRSEYLREQGFVLFAGQGPSAYNFSGNGYVYVDKTPLNGFSLQNSRQFNLARFFDAELVYDRENRPD